MIARLIFWLFITVALVILFLASRHRFRQVMWVGGLSIVSGVLLRLVSLRGSDIGELVSEGYFLVGIGAIYGIVWLGVRYLRDDESAAVNRKTRRRQSSPRKRSRTGEIR